MSTVTQTVFETQYLNSDLSNFKSKFFTTMFNPTTTSLYLRVEEGEKGRGGERKKVLVWTITEIQWLSQFLPFS
jgi:hypothetical protein